MRKIGLVIALIVMLAGVSVQAQKNLPKPGYVPPTADIVIQDDGAAGVLVIDPVTGVFKATLCEYGYEFSGKGEVKVDGCGISFSVLEPSYRVFAAIDMCDHHAKVVCQVIDDRRGGLVPSWIVENLIDSDMLNNTGECAK